MLLLLAITEMTFYSLDLPRTRMLEQHICRQLHGDPDSSGWNDEHRCKSEDVQSRLASVIGVLYALDALPSMCCRILYYQD
jgi:hypothetical protein